MRLPDALRELPAAQALREEPCACFGTGESALLDGRVLHLPADWSADEQAARALHLAAHRLRPPWPEPSELPCAERVDQALAAEAAAHVLELEARRALGVHSRYSFEDGFRAVGPHRRSQFMIEQLRAGSGGDVPNFVKQYASRCP